MEAKQPRHSVTGGLTACAVTVVASFAAVQLHKGSTSIATLLAQHLFLVLELALALLALAVLTHLTRQQSSDGPDEEPAAAGKTEQQQDAVSLTVFFASQKGGSRRLAEECAAQAQARGLQATAVDLATYDQERLAEERGNG